MEKDEKKKKGGKLKWVIIVIVVIIILAALFGDDDDDKPKKVGEVNQTGDAENNNEDEKTANEFYPGDVLETKTFRITFVSAEDYISDNEFIQPKDGNKFIKVSFEFENIGKNDEYVSDFDFKCYSDGYNSEQQYISDETLSATLSPGMKTKGSIIYEIPVEANEVLVQYETNMWTEDKINFYAVKK